MDLIFPDSGLVWQLQAIIKPQFLYKLFVNNVVPDRSTILANLTEAAWAGYSPVHVSLPDFTITGVAAHNGYAIAPPISFDNTSGAPEQAYGYYVVDFNTAAVLLAVALFDGAPITIPDGTSYNVVPIWGDLSILSS